jgi:hypothetical protein
LLLAQQLAVLAAVQPMVTLMAVLAVAQLVVLQ